MQLYLIRHAESENNARPAYQRVEDPAITARGHLQADHLAGWTKTLKIDALIASPFRRTLQTTRPIVEAMPLRLHVWHDIYERGGCFRGHLPGKEEGAVGLGRGDIVRLASARPDDCVLDETILDSGWWGGKPKESQAEAVARALAVTRRFAETFGNNGQTVVVVTHADFKRLLLGTMLPGHVDPEALGPMRNTGITKVNFDGASWKLDWFNSVSHLPAGLITGCEH